MLPMSAALNPLAKSAVKSPRFYLSASEGQQEVGPAVSVARKLILLGLGLFFLVHDQLI